MIAGLRPEDRIVVTGAAGWLGREVIARLLEEDPACSILAVGSRNSRIDLDLLSYEVVPWDDMVIHDWAPTIVVHLAFLTRERLLGMPEQEYVDANRRISGQAKRLFSVPSVRGVVVASSGAAVAAPGGRDIYGSLKAADEQLLSREGEVRSIPTVIARAWSLSGRHCPKPDHFLFYSLLSQVLRERIAVKICADHRVVRRYTDAGEFLLACVAAAAAGKSLTVDSMGELIEAGELAERMISCLGRDLVIERSPGDSPADLYFADSPTLDALASEFGLVLADLDSQIKRSTQAIL